MNDYMAYKHVTGGGNNYGGGGCGSGIWVLIMICAVIYVLIKAFS